jgi:hypothetical protein
MDSNKIINTSYMLAIVVFATWSVCKDNSSYTVALVLLILFAATKRVSHYFLHWLLVPINLVYNRPGTYSWTSFSYRWNPLLRLVVSIYSSYVLLDTTTLYFFVFILLAEAFSDWLLHGIFASLGVIRLKRWLFPSFLKKYNSIWFLTIIITLAYSCLVFRLIVGNSESYAPMAMFFLAALVLSDMIRWFIAFISYVNSKKYLPELPVTSMPFQTNHAILLSISLIFFNTKVESSFDGNLELVLFILVYVADVVVLQSDIYSDAQKGRWSELFDKPIFRYDSWFYWIVIISGIAINSFFVPALVWFFVFFRREWIYLKNYFDSSKNHVLDGAFFTLFSNEYFSVEAYEKVENKFGVQGYKTAVIFRRYYENSKRVVTTSDIVEQTKFCIVLCPEFSGWRASGTFDNLDYESLKSIVLNSIDTPYRLLSVVEYNYTSEESYLDSRDARLIDRYACTNLLDFEEDIRRQDFAQLQFLYSYLDEQPQFDVKIIDEVSIDTLKINDQLREFVQTRGIDVHTCYKTGLTPLLVLHRRTHEFSMVASRFMELLNLIEVAARWIMILERPRVINLNEDIQFSFGGVVSEIRTTSFAEVVLFENVDELNDYKKILRTTFGYNQKENVRFRVIDFMNWVVFIRNKTRGHGSPSRVSSELYQLLEVNTLRLLQAIAEQFDPELLMCSSEFYVMQRGMNFDFIYYNEQPLPVGVLREIKKPYVRHIKSNGWYTSDELLISKDNIYLLSAVKKGKCEWICYNTGELIRPDVIFN